MTNNSQRTHCHLKAAVVGTVLVGAFAAGGAAHAAEQTTTTTVAPVMDPLFPITVGSNGPAVAAVQGRLGITVDCDFGNQTANAVKDWQTERGDIAVTGIVTQQEWDLFAIPTTWGVDTNLNGKIEPSEVTLVCDGDVELPAAPIDTSLWPDTPLAGVAEGCGIPEEDAGWVVSYSPDDDVISISGWDIESVDFDNIAEGTEDYAAGCLLAALPDYVLDQVSATRAIDGMQTAEWGSFSAFWNYHPDNGINFTVRALTPDASPSRARGRA